MNIKSDYNDDDDHHGNGNYDEDLDSTAIARELARRPSPPKTITNTDTTREN